MGFCFKAVNKNGFWTQSEYKQKHDKKMQLEWNEVGDVKRKWKNPSQAVGCTFKLCRV